MASAAKIYEGLQTPYQANYRLRMWIKRWKDLEPEAVRNPPHGRRPSFAYEFEDSLTYLNAPVQWQSRLKTTNPIERFIRELNKKFRKVGIPPSRGAIVRRTADAGGFPSAQSWERTTYLVWRKLQADRYAPTARNTPSNLFTQTS